MQIVAVTLRYFAEEDAIYPIYDRAIELAWAVKAHAIVTEAGDENILNLQIAARMQEWQRVAKTF